MNINLEDLKNILAEYESRCGIDEPESILDFLWYCYSASSPLDDGLIRDAEEKLEPVFQELSFETSNILFDRISNLCMAYQRAAFLDGLTTGVRLSEELHTP